MRVKFQADADLDGRVIRGLRRVAPEIDLRTAAQARLAGLSDPEVLQIAADSGRILVSPDRGTMPGHFARYLTGARSRTCPSARSGSRCHPIEELLLIWSASEPAEWVDRLVWIPL